MAFGDGVPEDVKKKRTQLAWISFIADLVVATVLVFMASSLGDVSYYIATFVVASGLAFLYIFPRLPYGERSSAAPENNPDKK